MPQLTTMEVQHAFVEGFGDPPTFGGGGNQNASAIFGTTSPNHQPGLLEPVDETRGIGIPGDHTGLDRLRVNAVGSGGSDDAKGVVLRIRQIVFTKELRKLTLQDRMRPNEVQIRLLLGHVEGAFLPYFLLEVSRMSVRRRSHMGNICCNR